MEDQKHLLKELKDLDLKHLIRIMNIVLEIIGKLIKINMVIDNLLEITIPLKDILIIMHPLELMVGVKLLQFLIIKRVPDLVGVLIKLMFRVISIKVMMKIETTGLMLRINMVQEVLEIDMDREVKLIPNLELWVLKMLMLLLLLIEVDQETVLMERKDLWLNLNTKIKNMPGTVLSIKVITNMDIGTKEITGIIKLNLMDILIICLKEKVGLLDKLIKIKVLLPLVMVLKEQRVVLIGDNKRKMSVINGVTGNGEELNKFVLITL